MFPIIQKRVRNVFVLIIFPVGIFLRPEPSEMYVGKSSLYRVLPWYAEFRPETSYTHTATARR